MTDMRILEVKRRNSIKRVKFIKDMEYLSSLLNIKYEDELKEFDKLNDEIVNTFTELELVNCKINDLESKTQKLKRNTIEKNGIDLGKFVRENIKKEEVIDKLYQCEVMSSELWETLKTEIWNSRKKSSYELPNWK